MEIVICNSKLKKFSYTTFYLKKTNEEISKIQDVTDLTKNSFKPARSKILQFLFLRIRELYDKLSETNKWKDEKYMESSECVNLKIEKLVQYWPMESLMNYEDIIEKLKKIKSEVIKEEEVDENLVKQWNEVEVNSKKY